MILLLWESIEYKVFIEQGKWMKVLSNKLMIKKEIEKYLQIIYWYSRHIIS